MVWIDTLEKRQGCDADACSELGWQGVGDGAGAIDAVSVLCMPGAGPAAMVVGEALGMMLLLSSNCSRVLSPGCVACSSILWQMQGSCPQLA
jgi:hypothetical protein